MLSLSLSLSQRSGRRLWVPGRGTESEGSIDETLVLGVREIETCGQGPTVSIVPEGLMYILIQLSSGHNPCLGVNRFLRFLTWTRSRTRSRISILTSTVFAPRTVYRLTRRRLPGPVSSFVLLTSAPLPEHPRSKEVVSVDLCSTLCHPPPLGTESRTGPPTSPSPPSPVSVLLLAQAPDRNSPSPGRHRSQYLLPGLPGKGSTSLVLRFRIDPRV